MGLRRDGLENLSATMDRDYNEHRRPLSRNHSSKNSHDKNHRSSGERGLNGSRTVPVEKPLSVIINRNDSLENGHYSNSKSGYNHLLADDFTKKALDVVHGHSSSSTPVSSVLNSGPSTSSSLLNASFTSPPRLANRHEEVMKRKNIVEKIEKLRDGKKMETFIAPMDASTPNQISMNVRRYARSEKANLPEKMKNFILEGFDSPVAAKMKNNGQSSSKSLRMEMDGDATDYEDMEEDRPSECASSSHAQWLMERAEFLVMDIKIGESIETTDQRILLLTQKLEALESADGSMMENGSEEEKYSRLIPWDGTKRRKLVKMDEYLLNALPSTSKECAVLNPPSFTHQSLQYLHRTAIMPSFHIRKNKTKSIWLNLRELEEEKSRNGVKKKEERDRREKRKMERAEKEEEEEEKSDEYEATDDDEDDTMAMSNHSKRANGSPKDKRRKKDTERKSSRREINKNRRSSDCPLSRLSSVASRPSLDGDIDYLTPTFNHAHWLDNFKCQMPTNFTYNKIPVPECRRVRIHDEEVVDIEDAKTFNTENLIKKIAMSHHQLEHEERIRFTMHPRGVRSRGQRGVSRDEREASQDSARSRSTPSNREHSEEADTVPETGSGLPLPPPPPPVSTRGRLAPPRAPPISNFDYNSIRPIVDYDRLSIDDPYDKREFPVDCLSSSR